jgi:hypothetical protein
MRRLTIDAELPQKLARLLESAQICDADGNVLGVYTPDLSKYDLEPPFSEEELRAAAEDKSAGRTLDQIMAELEGQK